MNWRNHLIVGMGQLFGHVEAIAAVGVDEWSYLPQSPELMFWKRFAGSQLARRMNYRAGRVIHHYQPGLLEIKHFPQFFGNSNFIGPIFRWECQITAQGKEFLRVRVDVTALSQRKT